MIGTLAAALGGLDALVFTGGIGERSAEIRDQITECTRWLGSIARRAITTDEELIIAHHTRALLED
jgi:acetate kinase